ncbi:MAG: phosphoribosylanthranilate isomerase [Gammaproteobacteria bacterium]|nr:phosphoribosylanthranilate isomerase [Gammaproteobacteria bacterium]
MRIRVKICGITRAEDARIAADCGADAIGLVFYAASPRAVDIKTAAGIVQTLPAFVTSVGLFVNPRPEDVEAVLRQVSLDCLQFHGEESAEFCEQFGHPYLKAIRVQDGTDVSALASQYTRARAVLLDTYVKGLPGGTGQTFDWSRIPADCPKPVILAGGLTADNIAGAIQQVRPYAVDVSGGVEASKRIKDHAKIRQFIFEVNHVGASEDK